MIDRRSFSQEKREEILARQNFKCGCGKPLQKGMFEIDHIQALVHDGDHADDNLRAICFDCHKDKTRRDVQARSHADRVAVGGKQRSPSAPMPGTKRSGWKHKFGGGWERRMGRLMLGGERE